MIAVILELRLYAMYGSTRKILLLLVGAQRFTPVREDSWLELQVCLIFGEALAMGLVFGIPNPKLIGVYHYLTTIYVPQFQITTGTNEPFPGNFICADADPLDGTHWVVYYWASILIIEGTLLCLALRKAWQHRPTVRGSYLMRELTRDSVIYFFASVLAEYHCCDDAPLMKLFPVEFSGYISPTWLSGTRIEWVVIWCCDGGLAQDVESIDHSWWIRHSVFLRDILRFRESSFNSRPVFAFPWHNGCRYLPAIYPFQDALSCSN